MYFTVLIELLNEKDGAAAYLLQVLLYQVVVFPRRRDLLASRAYRKLARLGLLSPQFSHASEEEASPDSLDPWYC